MPLGRKGRPRQLRRGGFTSRDAAKQARDYLRDPAVGDPSRALISTAQWLQLWLDARLGPRESTMPTYRLHVRNYVIPYLGGTLLRELTDARVQAMFTSLGRPKSEASNRVLALDHVTMNVLRRYRDTCRNPLFGEAVGFLFQGGWGEPIRPDSVTHLFRRLNDEAGLPPIRLHDLRHGAAACRWRRGTT